MMQHFIIYKCIILVSLWRSQPQFSVLIWEQQHLVWSSAAVVQLLQGSLCYVFRDALPLLMVCNKWLF